MKCLVLFCIIAALVHAQPRRALVIGNAGYANRPLANPINDARAIGEALTAAQFRVSLAVDTTREQLDREVRQFIDSVNTGDAVVVYYAGHGVQIEGENYLVPTDFDARDETEAKYAAYPLSAIVDRLEKRKPQLTILVLDACRNNPFVFSRTAAQGLAAVNSGAGTYIAFATAPGSVAADNPAERNGLFTKHLLAVFREPGVDIDTLFGRVRERVFRASGGRQIPWSSSSLIGRFYIHPARGAVEGDTRFQLQVQGLPEPASRIKQSTRTVALSGTVLGADGDGRSVSELVKDGNYELAYEELASVSVSELSATALALRGVLAITMGDPKRTAVSDLTHSLISNADQSALLYWRGIAHLLNRAPQAALADFGRIADDSASLHAARALAHAMLQQTEGARISLDRALSTGPNDLLGKALQRVLSSTPEAASTNGSSKNGAQVNVQSGQ